MTLTATAFLLASTGSTLAAHQSKPDYITNGLACIHHYEGAWNANTGNGYYGGLQMDYDFMRTYGYVYLHKSKISFVQLWGDAHNWPIWAQMEAGRNGYKARGWYPWPNTARMCGLL